MQSDCQRQPSSGFIGPRGWVCVHGRRSDKPTGSLLQGNRRGARAENQQLQCLRSEEHTSELQSPCNLVCRLLLEKKKKKTYTHLLSVYSYMPLALLADMRRD